VAFPVAIGLALVIGVVVNYVATPLGSPVLLFGGVALVVAAILVDARAYAGLPSARGATGKGLALSALAGLLMGFFYRFVAAAMVTDFRSPQPERLRPTPRCSSSPWGCSCRTSSGTRSSCTGR
jgi:glucose uptake protein